MKRPRNIKAVQHTTMPPAARPAPKPASFAYSADVDNPPGQLNEGAGASDFCTPGRRAFRDSFRDALLRYNLFVPADLLEDMKRYVGFTEADARTLAELRKPLEPHLGEVVEQFYDTLVSHPGARAVFDSAEVSLDRLRGLLRVWLSELFSGCYDDAYFQRRCKIGRAHVRVNLPQHYMFTAMSVVRLALVRRIAQLQPPAPARAVEALHKLLDIELAIMNQTYREDLLLRMQEAEQAEFELRLSQSEHMAAVGRLAASLAHEIKNPLAGISGAIQVLGAQMGGSHPHSPIIEEALRQIDRLDGAVRDLLIYARPTAPTLAPTSIADIVHRAEILLAEEPAFRNVRMHWEGLRTCPLILGDAAQLQQVVVNLILNAAHACGERGDIHFRASASDHTVRVVVEDNGPGMPPEVRARAFEPFYTTKAKGTGLGLPICQRIVEAHNGAIALDSRVGKGTRVIIDLPRAT